MHLYFVLPSEDSEPRESENKLSTTLSSKSSEDFAPPVLALWSVFAAPPERRKVMSVFKITVFDYPLRGNQKKSKTTNTY